MGILKQEPNPVGRPSNEMIKKRKTQKIIIAVVSVLAVLLVGGGAYLLISGTSLSDLMGNSVTKIVNVCPNDYSYDSTTGKCITTKAATNTCPTGYTLTSGKCQKLTSTANVSASYSSKTNTYGCPSNSQTATSKITYSKSGNYTCRKSVYELKSPTKSCESGYTLNNQYYTCSKSTNLRNLKVSTNNYNINASLLGIENNVAIYDVYVGGSSDYKIYSNYIRTELYEVKGGSYNKISTMKLDTAQPVQFSYNSTKTYAARFMIKDAVTGETIYAPYSKKITLIPSKIPMTPQINFANQIIGDGELYSYENGKYTVDIALSNYKSILEQDFSYFSMGNKLMKVEIYEVLNDKIKYIEEYPVNYVYSIQLKKGEKKQYKVRLRFDEYGKKIYSDFSQVFTVDTNKFSS